MVYGGNTAGDIQPRSALPDHPMKTSALLRLWLAEPSKFLMIVGC